MGGMLRGRVAVVTGADSGIGQAIALAYAEEGADVAVTWFSDDDGARRTLGGVQEKGGRGITVQTDVRNAAACARLFSETRQALGVPDILVNNAGVGGPGTPVADTTAEDWDSVLKTNLYGPFYCCREFIRLRKASGGKGKIINVSSVHEEIVLSGGAAYDASKGGLRMLMRSLALELAPDRINVNNIGPGMILTPMNQQALDDPAERRRASERIPWKRPGEPREVARLAVYLASDDADYVTGQTFFIDGGLMLDVGQGA